MAETKSRASFAHGECLIASSQTQTHSWCYILLENWVFQLFLNFTPKSNLRFCGSMAEIEGSQPRVPGIHCITRFSILSQVFPCLIADSGGTIYLVLILQGDVYEATGCDFLGVWHIRTVGSDVSIPPPLSVRVGSSCSYHTISKTNCEPDSVSKARVCRSQDTFLQETW